MLVDAVSAEIAALPTYGYRRAGALVNRTRSLIELHPVNHKRFYRVMKQHGLLLPKVPKRRASSRSHEGMAVSESDRRWCSDGFKVADDNGQVVTAPSPRIAVAVKSSPGVRGRVGTCLASRYGKY
jgi:putative transposase